MIRRLILMTLLLPSLAAQDYRQLPSWASKEAIAAAHEIPPSGADAWVLLDRTEVAYVGDGEIRTHRRRLVQILSEGGLNEATYTIHSLGGKASEVRKIHGWNLRPDGEVTELDKSGAMVFDADRPGEISTSLMTAAVLPRAVIHSLVAFESEESVRNPMGPVDIRPLMETNPVRRWELEAASSGGWFTNLKNVAIQLDLHHFQPWVPAPVVVPGRSITALGVPPLPKNEGAAPHWRNAAPWVLVGFQDPSLSDRPAAGSWDALAKWVDWKYQQHFQPSKVVDTAGLNPKDALSAVYGWMRKELTYKAVYLSPERGWVPASGPDVVRHRYGDCKDLATCLLSEAKGLGMEVHPVLARIQEGWIEEDEPAQPFAFNHAIAAIKLASPMGFPAEFETPKGRFLLVDATARLTPMGFLPPSHRNRRVMICTGEGALWVTVPDSAIQQPASVISLDGTVDASLKVSATLKVLETGNHLGLRYRMLEMGSKALRESLVTLLELAPTGSLEIVSTSDPLDLTKPFEVVANVSQGDALRHEGKEYSLVAWGLPHVPLRIQRAGQARAYPVESDASGRLEWRAHYRLPFTLAPRVPSSTIESPFRSLQWSAAAITEEGRPALSLTCVQQNRPVLFGFGHQEEGATAWKKDRNQVLQLRGDNLNFGPPQ